MHGYGADGSDLISLSDYFSEVMPNTQFISPDAPFDCAMSSSGKEWFPIEKIPFGAVEAAKHFLEFLELESKFYSITFNNIFLIGFSQGAMLSLQIMLLSEKKIGGVVSFSGRLDKENINSSKNLILDGNHKFKNTPTLLVHGEMDNVVPHASLSYTSNLLKSIGFEVKILSRPNLGHGIDEEGITETINFLKKIKI